jgi:hypothetical protein
MLTVFAYAQKDCPPDVVATTNEVREQLDEIISETTVESKIAGTHYAQKLDVDVEDFYAFAEQMKQFGHKEGSDFDNWKNKEGNNPEHYMFYRVADGITDLYYEELDGRVEEQFQQYLPKDMTIFDKNTYNDFFNNKYFNGNSFSKDHWKAGGNVDARLADLRKLAQSFANILGITIDPAKITYRLFETQVIEGLPGTRMYIPTKTPRNDAIVGIAKWNDDVTSIEIDADELGKASVSAAISTIAEEVYHKYQMSVVQGKQSDPKKEQWANSYKDKDYGKTVNDLQKEINKLPQNDKRREPLEQQKDAAAHSYYQLAHEKDAKEFAGKMAAMEYFVRNIRNFKQD